MTASLLAISALALGFADDLPSKYRLNRVQVRKPIPSQTARSSSPIRRPPVSHTAFTASNRPDTGNDLDCDKLEAGIVPHIKFGKRCLYDWASVQGALLRRQRDGP